jgi:ectoine hydroxylase-related dioxygenase (phytanoyl-CoA dioxygenase family)
MTDLLLEGMRDIATDVDIASAKRDLDEFGYCLLPNALDPDQLGRVRDRLYAQAARETAEGWAVKYDADSQAVLNLVSKGQEFVDLVEAPKILELVEHLIGRTPLLSSITCNIIGPGTKAQALHGDQAILPAPWPRAEVCNVAWMIDDFTAENGATVIVPGSHKFGTHPDYANLPVGEPVVAPAGTAMVFDGRLWHGGGENRSNRRRHGILAYYCAPYIRQQENPFLSVDKSVIEGASERLRSLLGYVPYMGKIGAIVR